MKFRYAKINDINAILQIQESILLKNANNINNGFLVYPLSNSELIELIASSGNDILCAFERNEIVAYCITYGLTNWTNYKPNWLEKIEIPEKLKKNIQDYPTTYFRHIGKKIEVANVGSCIVNELIRREKENNIQYIICEILEYPYKNDKSIYLMSQKFNFVRIGKIEYSDQFIWGVYLKNIAQESL